MNTFVNLTLKHIRSTLAILMAIFAVVLLAMLIPVQPAHAQISPTNTGSFTMAATGAATNGVATVTTDAIDVPQGRALALFPSFVMGGAATGNVVWTAQVSYDGTTYTTSSGLTHTVAATGTTPVVSYWLLDPTELNAVRKIRLSTVSNAANSATITNLACVWSKQAL